MSAAAMTRIAMLRMAVLTCVVSACDQGAKLSSVWDLDVVLPDGWVRSNIQVGDTKAIEVTAPSKGIEAGEPAFKGIHIYFRTKAPPQSTATAEFNYSNHRHWNDEVKIVRLDETTLPDGWVAILETQTRVRPTPDLDVWSTRQIGGRYVDCIFMRPPPELAVEVADVCKSIHLRGAGK